MTILYNNNHSVFNINFHLVLVTKYRRKVISDAISQRCLEIFNNITPNYNVDIIEWNHEEDHIHILLRSHPNTDMAKFINAAKSASSRLLKNEFPDIKSKLWKSAFWTHGFCLISTGGANLETVRKYIQSQGDKHETK